MIKHIGIRREDVATKVVGIARGTRRDDKFFKNFEGTFEQMLDGYFKEHKVGDKDGTCILQGVLVEGTGQRQKQNMLRGNIVMLDNDSGTTIPEFVDIVVECEMSCLMWTTHSHMKTTSEVTEKAFDIWANKQPDFSGLSITQKVARYFSTVKSYTPAMVESISNVEKKMIPGGMTYVATHAPMPRFRALFILEEGFDFTAFPTHAIGMETWTKNYANFCRRLGVHFDSSCGDPSRLMYLPRRPAEVPAEQHEIIMIWGDCLTIERMAAGAPEANPLDAFVGPADKSNKFITPGLLAFAAKHIHSFEMADCMAHYEPDSVRGTRSNGPGIHFKCPNEEQHSVASPDDTAFMVTNASDGADGPVALCMHATCKEWSGGDRLMYVDKFAQNNDIKHADELMAFCTGEAREQANTTARGEAIAAAGDIDERINQLTPETPGSTITDIIAALSTEVPSVSVDDKLTQIVEKSGRGLRVIKSEYKRLRDAYVATNAPAAPELLREPRDVETYRGPVLTHWHETTQIDVARNVFVDANLRNPTIFKRREGGVVRAVQTYDGVVLEPVVTLTDWSSVIYDHVKFQQMDHDNGDLVYIVPPPKLVDHFKGRRDLDLPIVERVSRIPHLGPDGTLRWEKGYDAATRTYLDPAMTFRAIPDIVEDDDLSEAKYWLTEAVRDFPFSDDFNGSDLLPIKTNEIDADGFPEPNWDRGRSSRMNAFAMLTQPFVRDCIDGPCPAYHIDKSSPGTGAGYLTDVAYIIAEGTRAIAQTMSENPEEFRKAITATLREGASIIFIDNINQKVESGHLAAALTAGVWRDRVLGVSEVCTIQIRSTWIMAGNNLSFTPELMRRNIPIRLDASTVNPAKDRVGTKDFKHFPLQNWLQENRANLIWAIHVLLMNWVQKTNMAWGSKRLNSFDAWAGVMSGIFEAAGMEGFIENIPAYLDEMDEDSTADHELGKMLIERFGEDPCKVSDIQGVLENPMSDVTMDSLGIAGPTPTGRSANLGRYLSKMCKGRTYQPDPTNPALKYKLAKRTLHGYAVYQFNKLRLPGRNTE